MQFLDPFAAKKHKSRYDPEFGMQLKCVPEDFTSHAKITISEGSLTLKQLIDYLEKEFEITRAETNMDFEATPFKFNGIPITDCSEAELAKKVEDIAKEKGLNLLENNLRIEVYGYIGDDYLEMAPVKYIFA